MADLRGSSNCADHLTVGWLGREPSRHPKESGSTFKGTIPFSRAGVLSIQVYGEKGGEEATISSELARFLQ